MGKIEKVIRLTEKFEKDKVFKFDDSCLCEFSTFSKCSKCIDICPVECISFSNRVLQINQEVCIQCGACASICPSQALCLIEFLPKVLILEILNSSVDGRVNICCEYLYYLKNLKGQQLVLVPCLAVLDESILVNLFSAGLREINLYEGKCEKCPAKKASMCISMVAESMKALCLTHDYFNLIRYSPDFNYIFCPTVSIKNNLGTELSESGESKRKFFFDLKNKTREGVMLSVKNVDEVEFKNQTEIIKLEQKNNIDTWRNSNVLNFLMQFEDCVKSFNKIFSSRLFCDINIDFKSCIGCNLCYSFCPTQALYVMNSSQACKDYQVLGFNIKKCINCKLCQDVCKPGSIELVNKINLERFYSEEDCQFKIPTYLYAKEMQNG